MIKKFLLSSLCVLMVFINYAQIPAGYYDTATGNGYTLKTQLYNIIDGHTARTYDQLWTDFYSTDRKSNGYVWDMYSDIPGSTPSYDYTFYTEQCGNYSGEGSCYNREHSFPKSWFNEGTPMYSELFHLYPTDGYVNGKRSNYPFGEVGSASWTSTNGSKLGTCNYPGYSGTVFEPIDEYKGDFARTYFYMATRYENIIAGWENNDSNGDAVLNGTADQVYEEWYLNMIIEWHNNDPVSQKEIDRNNAVYALQNNRNPFIDHPEYVAKIWGGEIANNPPAISGIVINPANPRSTDAVNITATITDSDGTISSALLHWGIVSGSLTNTINLINTGGSTYTTSSTIPAQSDGVTVYYKIEATDDSSDVTITSENNYIVDDETNTTIFFEDFETSTEDAPININNWIRYEEAGTKTWEGRIYDSNRYAQFSAFNSGESSNISWLITPVIDLTGNATANFSFVSKDGYNNGEVLTVLISTNYTGTGSPAVSTWNNLNPIIASGTTSGYATSFTESGDIDITSYCGNTVFIAYKYVGGDPSKTTTLQIDNVSITGTTSLNVAPEISNIENNPDSPLEGQNVTISAIITDSDGTILSAKIKWGTVSGNYPNTINMNASGNLYSGVIPSQSAGTSVYYIIEATDNDNSIMATTQQNYFVTNPANEAPVISDVQYAPANPTNIDSVLVSASITDSDGTISAAVLRWKKGAEPTIYEKALALSENRYKAYIPAQEAGKTIYFIIVATDNNNTQTSYLDGTYNVIAANGFNEIDLTQVRIYPNPANENLTISFYQLVQNVEISIHSLAGNTIFKERFAHVDDAITLFLNDTNPGIYILQIKTQINQLNRKIIVN